MKKKHKKRITTPSVSSINSGETNVKTENKLNCWEFKKCGREPGGINSNSLGVCPASTETYLDGIHGGTNSGRVCWIVAGTFCKGEIQGSFANKYHNCEKCDFYHTVKNDEKEKGFLFTEKILSYLKFNEDGEKKKYRSILENMIDSSIISEALNNLDKMKEGEEKIISAFFSDIADFSVISEKLSIHEISSLLSEYLSEMTNILKSEKGTLDKYIGDAIVGIFGAPIDVENHAIHAARTAVKMLEKINELREKWKSKNMYCSEVHGMKFRIGINTGLAKVGFMGTDKLASYTMMGANVNVANWLENAGKLYNASVMISESTKLLIEKEFFVRLIDSVRMKGSTESIKIYELLGLKNLATDKMIESAEIFNKAFNLFEESRFNEAIRCFEDAVKISGNNYYSAEMMIKRCLLYLDRNNLYPDDIYRTVKDSKLKQSGIVFERHK